MLNKWRWYFLVDKETLWRPLLVHGPLEAEVFNRKVYSRSSKNSLWWRDIRSLCFLAKASVDWFLKGISCRLGTGRGCFYGKVSGVKVIFFRIHFLTCSEYCHYKRNSVGDGHLRG